MIRGISGTLLSLDALERILPVAMRGELDEAGRDRARQSLRRWHAAARLELGPATAARTAFDRLATPLFALLGYRVLPERATRGFHTAILHTSSSAAATLLVTDWGQSPGSAWRDAVHLGLAHARRWCFICSGPVVRIVDSERTFSRRYVEFDLGTAVEDERTFAIFWGLLRAGAMRPAGAEAPFIERAIALSEAHRAAVRTSLQQGVREALVELMRHSSLPFDEALVVVYRILFLLFAEARGLVPHWHPVYRDGYTVESLRGPVEKLARPRGVWEALQAIARLAHRGCRVGSLRVPPFNGHLFSPADAPHADRLPLDDGAVRQALLALTTRPCRVGRERIAYVDLGVEQLGGIYERLLDLEPAGGSSRGPLVRSEARKASGSFYTPRSLTDFLVRRTLAPLVRGATPEAILELRVLDPAMGSGAFLVASCRYLASAYEAALLREGGLPSSEIGEPERAAFRRAVAQRCLYGVDLNPMAVQLGRLSIWLATLAADRPLTFLDHRLRAGNSLVGAAPSDVARQPPAARSGRRRTAVLPLFDDEMLHAGMVEAIGTRAAIAVEPGDTLEQVRGKEQALARLNADGTHLARWRSVLDLWCSGWYRTPGGPALDPATFGSLTDALLGSPGVLPPRTAARLLEDGRAISSRERFFHWPIEFPEIFLTDDGEPRAAPGFDAIVGNPPWEMLRGDRGDRAIRQSARRGGRLLREFTRGSGIYRLQGAGHANLYQLFLERALQLLRRGGRLGVVLPSGFATDVGSAPLRRAVIARTTIDDLVGIENRDGVFPIHRGLRFLLLCATADGSSNVVPVRFGVRSPDALDRVPESGADADALRVSRSLLERASGAQLAIPDVRTQLDVDIVRDLAFGFPALGDPDGWGVSFGRELNASDDRGRFTTGPGGLPVIEGKQISPFHVRLEAARFHISEAAAASLLDPERTFRRSRLAYRDVASAGNRLTLIAAIVPAGTVTTHTLFCVRNPLDEEAEAFLCGVFNSYVANYLVRLQVNTHVSAAIVARLPVPRPAAGSVVLRQLAGLARRIVREGESGPHARLQAGVAHLYGLTRRHFQHVLDTFPLVPRSSREAAMEAFCDIVP